MKFYSELLHELYDTKDELFKAEDKAKKEKAAKELAEKKKTEEKKVRKEEIDKARVDVENAQKLLTEAKKRHAKLVDAYTKDYGSYSYSCRKEGKEAQDELDSLFVDLFSMFN